MATHPNLVASPIRAPVARNSPREYDPVLHHYPDAGVQRNPANRPDVPTPALGSLRQHYMEEGRIPKPIKKRPVRREDPLDHIRDQGPMTEPARHTYEMQRVREQAERSAAVQTNGMITAPMSIRGDRVAAGGTSKKQPVLYGGARRDLLAEPGPGTEFFTYRAGAHGNTKVCKWGRLGKQLKG